MAMAYYGEIASEDDMESSAMQDTFPDYVAIIDSVAGGPYGLAEGIGRYTSGRVVGHFWSTDSKHWIEALWYNVATLERPTICLIPKAQNVGSVSTIPHYVLVDGFSSPRGGTVAFSDPATGARKRVTWDKFGAGWGKNELWDGKTIHGFQAIDVRRGDDYR